MKGTLAKFAPFVVGIALGWMLLAAPEWFSALGPLRYAVGVLLVAALLIGVVIVQILAALPAAVELTPLPGAERADLRALADGYLALGFFQAGPPLSVGVAPPAVLLPFVHEQAYTYGTVFRTGTVPAKTSYDFVSILEGARGGGLTTGPEWRGATLPAGPGDLRQVFQGAGLETLFQRHKEGLDFLRTRGLRPKRVSAATFADDFRAAIAYQRRSFLSNPVVNATIAIWRSAVGRSPHMGPIGSQRGTATQIRRLLTGQRT
jgi:hypothetical protein